MYNIEEIKNTILCGDTLTELKKFPNECIDCIVTSPPYYGLRDYGVEGQIGLENTFTEYLDKMMAIFAEVKRVLKSSGSFWLNMGDCYGGERWSNSPGTGPWKEGSKVLKANIVASREIGFDKRNYGGLGEKRQDTTRQGKGRRGNDASKSMLMQPERMAIRMLDDDGDDIYELKKDLTQETILAIMNEINKYGYENKKTNKTI